jgi:intein-encoded DNA endonuclease-like protein
MCILPVTVYLCVIDVRVIEFNPSEIIRYYHNILETGNKFAIMEIYCKLKKN